jgi:hypothetical protein
MTIYILLIISILLGITLTLVYLFYSNEKSKGYDCESGKCVENDNGRYTDPTCDN